MIKPDGNGISWIDLDKPRGTSSQVTEAAVMPDVAFVDSNSQTATGESKDSVARLLEADVAPSAAP